MKPDTFPFFTPSVPGLEPYLQRELWTLGVHPKTEDGGFFWLGTWKDFYRAQLTLRGAGRVLVRIKEFEALTFSEWEQQAAGLPWHRFVRSREPFKLKVSCAQCGVYHEDALAERLGSWIAAATGAVWQPEGADDQTQILVVRGWRDRFTLSADGSGEHLHKRGYRLAAAKAPLRETIAAALLQASGWIPSVTEGSGRGQAVRYKAPALPLTDPFCGSGTLVIEAALAARRIPPGLANPSLRPRAYAFTRWPSFDPELWDKTVRSLQSHVLPAAGLALRGSDRDEGAIAAAQANAARAGVAADTVFERRALSDAVLPEGPGFVVTNPPFGVRVSEKTDLRDLYAVFGRRLREHPALSAAWLCADPRWRTAVGGGRAERTFPNGGLDLTIVLHSPAAPLD